MFLAGARALGVPPAACGGVRGRGGRGAGRPRRASSGTSSAWTASATARRRAAPARGRASWSRTSPSCSTRRDRAPGVPGRAVGGPRDRACTWTTWPRPSRCSRWPTATSGCAATSTRASPTASPAPTSAASTRSRPLPYAEAGYGYPEDGQTVVNVTNGKLIRLLVEDEPFDVRYGELRATSACWTCATACCAATVEWISPTGRAVRVRSTRLVSFTHRAVAAIEYVVEPVDDRLPVVVQSRLVANEPVPAASRTRGPRRRSRAPLESDLYARRRRAGDPRPPHAPSGLRVAAAMDHLVEGPEGTTTSSEAFEDQARVMISADLAPGKPLRIVKFLAYGWSAQRSVAALRDQVAAARPRRGPRRLGRAARRPSASYLDDFWERSDVEIDGDAELQQAIRFGLFHTLQAGARGEQRAIAAKGLTGPGLRRPHLLGHRDVRAAGAHLHRPARRAPTRCAGDCRRSTWPATAHSTLGLDGRRLSRGARSTARSARATGRRARRRFTSTPTSPTRSAATRRRPDDTDFERGSAPSCWSRPRGCGGRSATTTPPGDFRIDGVTGPDEYSAVADNNVYTNLMAQRNLARRRRRGGAPPAPRRRAGRRRRGGGELARRGRRRWSSPMTRRSRSTPSRRVSPTTSAGTSTACATEQYPLLLNFPYFDLYRKQVVKQADLVLALFCAATPSPPRRSPATSTTTRSSPSVTPRCRPAVRRSWPPRSATSTSPMTTSPRRR